MNLSFIEAIVVLVGSAGFLFALIKTLNGLRKVVHFFDRTLQLADKIDVAVDLIVTEFSPNGGASFKDKHNQMSEAIKAIDKRTEVITGMMIEETEERRNA